MSMNKIISRDGTKIIKDSVADVDATGNINIPFDQGYFINYQLIVYQDNADSSKYKVEVHQGKFNNVSNQIILQFRGVENTTTITHIQPTISRTYTIPDVAADAVIVMNARNQMIFESKVFSGTLIVSGQSVFHNWISLQFGSVGDNITLEYNNPALLTNTLFLMKEQMQILLSEGAQSINGIKTLNSITSVGENDKIIIVDANGTENIYFNTIGNWAAKYTNYWHKNLDRLFHCLTFQNK